jgi:hypothetical protein
MTKSLEMKLQRKVKVLQIYSPEAELTSEAQDEVSYDEAQDGSQEANQSKNAFKYKSSHPEDQIIGNKESPRRTRSYFRQEESMI